MPSDEPIKIPCPNCQREVRTLEGKAGSKIRCPECQHLISISDAKIAAIPTEDDGSEIPSLEDLEHSSLPMIGAEDVEPEPGAPEDVSLEELLDLDEPVGRANEGDKLKFVEAGSMEQDDVMGIMCHVCDTRIHVKASQMGTKVECPICYVQVEVQERKKKKKNNYWGRGGATDPNYQPGSAAAEPVESMTAADLEDSGELKLSDTFERPKVADDYGLAPMEGDALKPIKRKGQLDLPAADPEIIDAADVIDSADIPELEVLPDDAKPETDADSLPSLDSLGTMVSPGSLAGKPEPSITPANKPTPKPSGERTRKEKIAAAEAKQAQRETASPFQTVAATDETTNFPEFEFGEIAIATKDMWLSKGLLLRVAVALVLMIVGVAITEKVFPYGFDSDSLEMGEYIVKGLLLAIGCIPYFLGLAVLWYLGGAVFRDAALGRRQIKTWKSGGRSEMTATMLIFSFSFLVAGSPAFFFPVMMIVLRVMFGPLLLMGAWLNQSAFQIINVDIFQNVKRIGGQWQILYLFMVILGAIGLFTGCIFLSRGWSENYLVDLTLSIVGVFLNVFITLSFAAIVGWHTGRAVEDMQNS